MRHYDGCFISFSDARFDARLQNLLATLSEKFDHLALVQLGDTDETFKLHHCDVFSARVDLKRRGFSKFFLSYLHLLPKAFAVKAKFYCAEDVFSLPIASILSKKNQAQLFYDSRELYFAIGALANKRLKQQIWEIVEARFIESARVFTTGDLDSKILQERYQIPLPKTIYNFPQLQTVPRNQSLQERLGLLEGKIILLYQGMIGEGRGIWKMLDALAHLPESFALVFIGDGVLLEKLRNEIQKRRLQERAFALGVVPYQALLPYTASADIGLALIEPISKSYELALPNKLFEYVMCETPPIVSNLPAMNKIIDDYQVGIATSLEVESIVSAILAVSKNLQAFRERCRSARLKLNWAEQSRELFTLFRL